MLSTRWTHPRDPDYYAWCARTPSSVDPFTVDEIKYGPFRCTGGEDDAFRIWTFKYHYSYQRFCAAFITLPLEQGPPPTREQLLEAVRRDFIAQGSVQDIHKIGEAHLDLDRDEAIRNQEHIETKSGEDR